MNNIALGCCRDREIVRVLELYKALDTDQIAALLFRFPYGRRVCQKRLLRLYERQQVKRVRLYAGKPYVYSLGERPRQTDHLLAVNWTLADVYGRLGAGHVMGWVYEPDYTVLRPDAFYSVQDSAGKFEFAFIEVDMSENKWDKVQLYNTLYERPELYEGLWWATRTKVFPTVICVASAEGRYSLMQRSVQRENRNGLRFDIRRLSDIERRGRGVSGASGGASATDANGFRGVDRQLHCKGVGEGQRSRHD